jgi:hypothetical protein
LRAGCIVEAAEAEILADAEGRQLVLQECADKLHRQPRRQPDVASFRRFPNEHPRADGATEGANDDEAMSPDPHGADSVTRHMNDA